MKTGVGARLQSSTTVVPSCKVAGLIAAGETSMDSGSDVLYVGWNMTRGSEKGTLSVTATGTVTRPFPTVH